MRLRFVPKRDAMPKWPGRGAGDYPYVGRKFDAATRNNAPTGDAAEVDSESEDARRLIQVCTRDGDLLPADEQTAKFCGVEFTPLTRDSDGEWIPAPKREPEPMRKTPRKADD